MCPRIRIESKRSKQIARVASVVSPKLLRYNGNLTNFLRSGHEWPESSARKQNHLNLQNNSADSFQPIQQKGLRLFMRRPLWHLQNTEKIRADRSEDKLLLSVGELRSYGALGNHMSTLL